MNPRGWESVAELPTGKPQNIGYRKAGAPDPIVADERWRNPLVYLRLWLRSGPAQERRETLEKRSGPVR